MELPIDHFRLLGVSPSASAEAVLRAYELRLDRTPEQGFTHEVLLQRAELLRLSADLLSDQALRQEYEVALLAGASGLELSSQREVAGLILLWEADASYEAFKLAKKALMPPQTPALGSGREADLTLVAALSCRAASRLEQEERHYQSAAVLLQDGIQLLQRMGKLPDHRKVLEEDLEALLPYRILDLLSRDLSDQSAHQVGLNLLDNLVIERGGLEGKNLSKPFGGLLQNEFEVFFQQIRKFLTVQEQLDLFLNWQKRGSSDAGFLGATALIASGFSQRKPERLVEAKKYLKGLNLAEIDFMPLMGCIDLLLADIDKAEKCFRNSDDESLRSWLENYPGDVLAALCDYCRDWLRRDVLPGYRDVDPEVIDLEAWFADRDVQAYVENLDAKGALDIAKAGFSFLKSRALEDSKRSKDIQADDLVVDPYQPGETVEDKEENLRIDSGDSSKLDLTIPFKNFTSLFRLEKFKINKALDTRFFIKRGFLIRGLFLFIVVGIPIKYFIDNKNNSLIDINPQIPVEEKKIDSENSSNLGTNILEDKSLSLINTVKPLTLKEPDLDSVQTLITSWLKGKADSLAGKETEVLNVIARENLVKRINEERLKDIEKGEKQIIEANITSLDLIDRTPRRIEVKTKISYRDRRVNSSGEVISETNIPSLRVTYILGFKDNIWQLVAYISGK